MIALLTYKDKPYEVNLDMCMKDRDDVYNYFRNIKLKTFYERNKTMPKDWLNDMGYKIWEKSNEGDQSFFTVFTSLISDPDETVRREAIVYYIYTLLHRVNGFINISDINNLTDDELNTLFETVIKTWEDEGKKKAETQQVSP